MLLYLDNTNIMSYCSSIHDTSDIFKAIRIGFNPIEYRYYDLDQYTDKRSHPDILQYYYPDDIDIYDFEPTWEPSYRDYVNYGYYVGLSGRSL